jgi:hypothetical protein
MEPMNPSSHNEELLKLMRAREERESREAGFRDLERQKVEEEHEARVQRRKTGDAYMATEEAFRQSKCDHRKGTAGSGRKFKIVDYMMNRNTFQNGVTRIKCEKCRFRWFPGDTKEFVAGTMENCLKKIRKTPNPTRLSYNEVWGMTNEENTTNTPSRAEMVTTGPASVTP